MEFTDEEKDKLLIIYKFEKIVGYCMDYAPPEADNVIITVDEIKLIIGKQAEVYYFEEHGELAREMEDAWECLFDMVYNELDTDDECKVEEHLKSKLKNAEAPTKDN